MPVTSLADFGTDLALLRLGGSEITRRAATTRVVQTASNCRRRCGGMRCSTAPPGSRRRSRWWLHTSVPAHSAAVPTDTEPSAPRPRGTVEDLRQHRLGWTATASACCDGRGPTPSSRSRGSRSARSAGASVPQAQARAPHVDAGRIGPRSSRAAELAVPGRRLVEQRSCACGAAANVDSWRRVARRPGTSRARRRAQRRPGDPSSRTCRHGRRARAASHGGSTCSRSATLAMVADPATPPFSCAASSVRRREIPADQGSS